MKKGIYQLGTGDSPVAVSNIGTWTHGFGRKATFVQAFNAASGALIADADLTITQPDANSIVFTAAPAVTPRSENFGGGGLTITDSVSFTPVDPNSVNMIESNVGNTGSDDGNGNIVGNINGTFNYANGAFDVNNSGQNFGTLNVMYDQITGGGPTNFIAFAIWDLVTPSLSDLIAAADVVLS